MYVVCPVAAAAELPAGLAADVDELEELLAELLELAPDPPPLYMIRV